MPSDPGHWGGELPEDGPDGSMEVSWPAGASAPARAPWQPGSMATPLAGLPSRLVSRAIDTAIVLIMTAIVLMVAGLAVLAVAGGEAATSTDTGSDLWLLTVGIVVIVGVPVIYETAFVAASGQTFGKRFMGIKVCASEDGGRPSFAKSLLRSFLVAVPVWSVLLALPALFRRDRRALHDMMCGTVVMSL